MLWITNEDIAIFLSQKSDGDMLFDQIKKDVNQPDNGVIRKNRARFFKKHGIEASRLVNTFGTHGNSVATINSSKLGAGSFDPEARIKNTDDLISSIENSYLMITGADCFPVFFYDEKRGAIGVAHCGWRGIIEGIIVEMIKKFKNDFGSVSSDVKTWIGPGIKNCHYDVPRERAVLFSSKYKKYIIEKGGKIFLDLDGVIKTQLSDSGVKTESITTHPDCTNCEKDKWFSARRDKPKNIEAFAAIIHLK